MGGAGTLNVEILRGDFAAGVDAVFFVKRSVIMRRDEVADVFVGEVQNLARCVTGGAFQNSAAADYNMFLYLQN